MLIVLKDKNDVSLFTEMFDCVKGDISYTLKFKDDRTYTDESETKKKTEVTAFIKKNKITTDKQTLTIGIKMNDETLAGGKKKTTKVKKTVTKKVVKK